MDIMVMRHGYLPSVIHAIDRQRYYESLRSPNSKALMSVYLEGVETTAASAVKVYEEALKTRRRSA